MCLTLRKHDKVRVARFPKLVWKIVHIAHIDNEYHWVGPFRRSNHKFEECLKAEEITSSGAVPIKHLIITENIYGNKVINPGFHAFRSLYKAKSSVIDTKYRNFESWLNLFVVVPCIIPKGSEYCKGRGNEIVSTDIIVFKSFRHLVDWKLEKIKFTWSRLFS